MLPRLTRGGVLETTAAALRWLDIERWPDGSGRVTIARSKTDVAGEGAVVAITAETLRELEAIRNGAPPDAPLFPFGKRAVANRVKAAAQAAGLGDGFSRTLGTGRHGQAHVRRGRLNPRGDEAGALEGAGDGGQVHSRGDGGRGATLPLTSMARRVDRQMRDYKHIPYWENRRRREKLVQFRNDVVEYCNDVYGGQQNTSLHEICMRINSSIQEVRGMVYAAGVGSNYRAFGGPMRPIPTSDVDLLSNIFNLRGLNIPPNNVTDVLEQAIGVYEADWVASIIRTTNPPWWAGQLLGWFLHLPFALVGAAGFNVARAEASTIGKVVKLLTVAGSVCSIVGALALVGVL